MADGSAQQACVLYIGSTFQWIRVFREEALTLPWGEDWVWQSPIGTQQMMTMSIDAFRSGVYWAGAPPTVDPILAASTWDYQQDRYASIFVFANVCTRTCVRTNVKRVRVCVVCGIMHGFVLVLWKLGVVVGGAAHEFEKSCACDSHLRLLHKIMYKSQLAFIL
jgi:hypothetical protein